MKSYRLAILIALAMAASITTPKVEAGQISNGGFETGDLSGWTANDTDLVTAEFSVNKLNGPGVFFPAEGDYLGYLKTGIDVDEPTLLSQAFTTDSPTTLSFQVFFDAGDDVNNDFGFARLLNASGAIIAELFRSDVATVGAFGSTDWTAITYTIANAGAYVLQFGVVNVGDNDSAFDSALGVDAVLTTAAVPEPSTFVASVIAIAGLCMLRRGSGSSARRVAA